MVEWKVKQIKVTKKKKKSSLGWKKTTLNPLT